MYHLNTFQLQENEGDNQGGQGEARKSGGCIQKAMKKCHEINIISTLRSNKNSLKSAMKLGIFLLSSLTISLYSESGHKGDGGKGGLEGGSGECIQKAIKKCHEINIISNLTSNKNSLKTAMNVGIFLLSSSTIWLDYY